MTADVSGEFHKAISDKNISAVTKELEKDGITRRRFKWIENLTLRVVPQLLLFRIEELWCKRI